MTNPKTVCPPLTIAPITIAPITIAPLITTLLTAMSSVGLLALLLLQPPLGLLASGSAVPNLLGQELGPSLTIAEEISVTSGNQITVPIAFIGNGNGIAGVGLSIDFDETCLAFDDTDGDANSIPDSITIGAPAQFFPSVSYNAEDSDGEIDIILADYSPPLAALPDSEALISMTFTATCEPENTAGESAPIAFSSQPAVSFSNQQGQDVAGSTASGSVFVLPSEDSPPPITATIPPATLTPTSTITVTSTVVSTATPAVTPTVTPQLAETPAPNETPLPTETATATATLSTPTTTIPPSETATLQPTASVESTPATTMPAPANQLPIANEDSTTTDEDTPVNIQVLQNDSDPDGDLLKITQVEPSSNGLISINSDNTITYTPTLNYSGTDSFIYSISDGKTSAVPAIVRITIRAVNDSPVMEVAPDDQNHPVGSAIVLFIFASDPDTDQGSLEFSAQGLPHGLTIDAKSGLITGTLAEDAAGTYATTITVSDGALQDSIQFEWVVSGEEQPDEEIPTGVESIEQVYLPFMR